MDKFFRLVLLAALITCFAGARHCVMARNKAFTGATLAYSVKPAPTDLEDYLRLMQKVDPYAVISGWFWDWRSISLYRQNPGYHLGYDIALPAGTPVPAGWGGKVTGIASWTSSEWGISVVTSQGYTVTYGHLSPRVSAGDLVGPGTIVGTVVIDHVDIKIKDLAGNFIDFGKTSGLLPVDDAVAYMALKNYYSLPHASTVISLKAKKEEIARLRQTISILEDYLEIELEAYEEGKRHLEEMKRLLEEELISRNSLTEETDKVRESSLKTSSLRNRLALQKKRIALLQRETGITSPQKSKAEGHEKLQPSGKCSALTLTRIEEARKKSELFEKLYSEGAVSRKELEDAKKEYKRVQLEALLEEK
ncbi:MAG: peptidoglycan DD-metalloendopeptidase family protein [Candidatus Eremiobacteraeota bacterium]|nr:peptidoglycan DD-metalloendopeptidase family protein [Candidatus Eremiobacteraeota bacterium]